MEVLIQPLRTPPMVEATAVLARRKGIDPGRIHAEALFTQPN